MKYLACFFGLTLTLYVGAGAALAQHGHGPGGSMGVGSMHGNSDAHGNPDAPGSAASSSHATMASTNPGNVLDHNTHLSAKLEGLLNLSGPNALSTLKTDAAGFKNFGQFVAAVHVSHNLEIPFADLQSKMTGTGGVSLGKAIQGLKPAADSKAEVKKANAQANEDVNKTS